MMKVLIILAIVILAFFIITFGIYWFNLDTKLVIFPVMTRHYDNMERDRKL